MRKIFKEPCWFNIIDALLELLFHALIFHNMKQVQLSMVNP